MSIDAKRDEYRKYLERTGAMDALTKVLVALYEESEKPEDSVAYIKRNLGGFSEEGDLVEQLAAAHGRIKELEEMVANCTGPTENAPDATSAAPTEQTETSAPAAPAAPEEEAASSVAAEPTPEAEAPAEEASAEQVA